MADVQAIKDRIDIAQLIQEYVPLKKAGINYKANCPFHHEKTPSFVVQPEKQIWHCFGCGAGGDIFSFIEKIEGLDFIEALKLLAQRAGIKIDNFKSEVNSSQRNRLLEINEAAATFFHKFLLEIKSAGPARDYLKRRGLTEQTIDDWQIGYITDQWDLLTQYLIKKGFGIDDLVAAGLTIKRDGADAKTGRGYYDRFRGRVMFPISDAHGNVVGFTGRILVETENSGGKYVNTPQTVLYDKSRVLYGLHKAKTEIKNKDLVILVEGQMDVIANHQAGITNVVAASGTALTAEQVKLIKRYTGNIAMAFDADAAGENAGKRGISMAMEQGLNVKVIQIPPGAGKDADECLQKNPAVWREAVKNARLVLDWYFDIVLSKVNLKDSKQKQQAAVTLLTEIARLPYAVERDEWIKKLSDRLSIEINILRDEAKHIKLPKSSESKFSPPGAPQIYKSVGILTEPDSFETLLTEAFSLLIKFPELAEIFFSHIKPVICADTHLAELYDLLKNEYNSEVLNLDIVRGKFNTSAAENPVDVLLLRPYNMELNHDSATSELPKIIARLKIKWRAKRGNKIKQELAEAEKQNDKVKMGELLKELQQL